MKYEYTKECETGIELLDSEHKQFFAYLNSAMEALNSDDHEAMVVAKNLIKKLNEYAYMHFKHEEDYMKEHQDAELVLQIMAHEKFRTVVQGLMSKEDPTKEDLKEIVVFMTRWLYSHIVTTDTLIGKIHTGGKFKFTKEFYTNIPIVDTEHAKLFEIIGRAQVILHDDMAFDKYDLIMGVLAELKDYTVKHFADEEEYMASIEYEGLPAQKAVHEAFIDKVVHVDLSELDSVDENPDEYIESLLGFLNEWLVEHILKMDKKIPAEKK